MNLFNENTTVRIINNTFPRIIFREHYHNAYQFPVYI